MSILHKLRYKRTTDFNAEIYVDDKPIKCRRFSFEHELNSIPYAEVEVLGNADIDALADIGLRVCIKDIDSAITCLKLAYRLNDKARARMVDDIMISLGVEMSEACEIAEKLLGDGQ